MHAPVWAISLILALIPDTFGAIGPRTELVISNAAIAPDGYTRDAVVVNGIFPGPLITGKKVGGLI